MAGQPRRRAMTVELERLTRDYFEITPGERSALTPVDFAVAWVEDGGTLTDLAAAIEKRLSLAPITRYMVQGFLDTFGEKESERIVRARARSGHGLAERAKLDLDNATNETLALARERARVRTWLAEKYTRDVFGKQPDTVVAISAGSLHLAALRAPRAVAAGTLPSAELPAITSLPSATVDAIEVEVTRDDGA